MGTEIKKLDGVWTADELKLGTAQLLYHRTEDANPDLQLYETYLLVEDFDYGESFYVPTEFIAGRQADKKRLDLSKRRDEAMQLTWYRMPDFVAQGHFRKEALPE